jgi:hypothetical protein
MLGKPGDEERKGKKRAFNCDEEDEYSYVNTCVYFTEFNYFIQFVQ